MFASTMAPPSHLPLSFLLAVLLLVGTQTTVAKSTIHHVTSYEVQNPPQAGAGARHATVVVADRELPLATTTELTAEEFDEEDDSGRDEEPVSTEDETSTSLETPAPPQPSISNVAPPQRVTNKPERRFPSTTSTTTTTTTSTAAPMTTTTTTRRSRPTSPRATVPPAVYGAPTGDRSDDRGEDSACPRREDIHPCQCLEIPSKIPGDVETVATCKNIRNQQVLSDALKGFQRHKINFFVLDSCKLPPFPNGLFHNVDIEWMEVLNSTVQFQKEFFGCSKGCL